MQQIVLKIGSKPSEFYFPQNEIGFEGIREVISDIMHSEKEAEMASKWCENASLGDKYEKAEFNLEIRA